ncbi:LysM peptidoglycan-binding domain-containing protein [Paenibacillus sp. GCM10012307]|uniref:LysM peptidoglycan-binding domain-containing protein n=1 Tax=Paenibacillus roseus TaxID=2798579 RepID=A0A934J9I1_9BACL|nr:LysM peptidoglycan-binding domain-containing protein [Paenibacillus roseus]
MPNSSNGLRFDVYERVHLSEDVAGIGELDEIELTPHIQVISHGEQILLRGNLLLAGVYDGQGEVRTKHTLEHLIPVEITLPLNRVHRVEDISVEIDNFDVDILNTKTLNIIGVLSLRGLQIEQAGGVSPDSNVWDEESITVVHRIEQTPEEALLLEREPEETWAVVQPEWEAAHAQSEPYELAGLLQPQLPETDVFPPFLSAPGKASEPLVAPPLQRFEPSIVRTERLRESPVPPQQVTSTNATAAWPGLPVQDERQLVGETAQAAAYTSLDNAAEEEVISEGADPFFGRESDSIQTQSELEEAEQAVSVTAQPTELAAQYDEAETDTSQPLVLNEAPSVAEVTKTEMKIAFSGKESQSNSFGLSSLLHSNKREQEAKALAKQQEEASLEEENAQKRIDPGEEVEWKKLFLNNQGDEREFRKLRICIVQREETLETIAGRYQLNPREILLYNRLADQHINEGQVLYIPQVQ